MNSEGKEKILSFLDKLTDALGESQGILATDIIADLTEEGVEVDASIKHIQMMVEQASQKARRQALEIAKEKRLNLEAEKPARLGEFLGWAKEKIIEKINELLPTSGPLASVSYRELQAQSQDDLAALLEDLISTREMEEPEP